MNVVLDEAAEVYVKSQKPKRPLGMSWDPDRVYREATILTNSCFISLTFFAPVSTRDLCMSISTPIRPDHVEGGQHHPDTDCMNSLLGSVSNCSSSGQGELRVS